MVDFILEAMDFVCAIQKIKIIFYVACQQTVPV